MDSCDVLIVGGGPAGSTCAWRLKKHGIGSVILDAAEFPRLKPCAGWITPGVVRNLEIDPSLYPHGLVTFPVIRVEYFGKKSSFKREFHTTQHSIRRYEFDDWLLRRSGARIVKHRVRQVRRLGDRYVIDGVFRAKYLVGAGGTHCPVYRLLFQEVNPRSAEHQVAALEEEFRYPCRDEHCYLWLAERGLVGYSWYVPKGNDWINVGIGGFSKYLRQASLTLREHWDFFTRKLSDLGLVPERRYDPRGYTYYVREPAKVVQLGNAYVVGDAAGLATSDLAEGIGPAVESALRAADAIAGGSPYSVKGITRYSLLGRGVLPALMQLSLDRSGTFFSDRLYARNWRSKERC